MQKLTVTTYMHTRTKNELIGIDRESLSHRLRWSTTKLGFSVKLSITMAFGHQSWGMELEDGN